MKRRAFVAAGAIALSGCVSRGAQVGNSEPTAADQIRELSDADDVEISTFGDSIRVGPYRVRVSELAIAESVEYWSDDKSDLVKWSPEGNNGFVAAHLDVQNVSNESIPKPPGRYPWLVVDDLADRFEALEELPNGVGLEDLERVDGLDAGYMYHRDEIVAGGSDFARPIYIAPKADPESYAIVMEIDGIDCYWIAE